LDEYRIDISPTALNDIKAAYSWIKERSPSFAAKWYDGLFDAILSLGFMPTRCATAPESEDLEREIRQLHYRQRGVIYRILFSIEGDLVRIHLVRHSARDRVKKLDFGDTV
jgi:plasmid stabilization system protein ParE